MTEFEWYGIDCKNQSSGLHPFQIPPPKIFGTSASQSETARDIEYANLLCPECRHVFAYTAQDVHRRSFRTPDRDLFHIAPICFFVEFLCGTTGCIVPMKVHVFAYGHEQRSIVLAQMKDAQFFVTCYEGHYPSFDPKNLIHVDAIGPFGPF